MRSKVRPGMRFSRLTAIKLTDYRRSGRRTWLCQCDCGNQTLASGCHLLAGQHKSCGCLARTAHRENATRLYSEILALSAPERQRYYSAIGAKVWSTRRSQADASKASAATLQSSARRSQPFRKKQADGIEA